MRKLILILALLGSNAHAEFISGNDLYERLRSPTGQHDKSFAMGYITGVHDGLEGIMFCTSPTVTIGQIRDVVFQWMTINPQFRDRAANLGVVNALREVWPCKKGTGS